MRTLIGKPKDRELSSTTRLLGVGRQNVGNLNVMHMTGFELETSAPAGQLRNLLNRIMKAATLPFRTVG